MNSKYTLKEILGMKKRSPYSIYLKKILAVSISLILAMSVGCATSGSKTAEQESSTKSAQVAGSSPQVIPQGVTCGKCGMYPASYPRWQSQIIFKEGTMTPFDGCK